MKVIVTFCVMLLVYGCMSSKELSIEVNHFNKERSNKTTLQVIKRKYPFAKREKHFRSILWRTDDGRVCETVYTEFLTLKTKGIKLTFLYSGFEEKKERTISKIEFYKNAYFLKNGITVNQSRLSDVDSLYNNIVTEKTAKYIAKKTDHTSFFAFYSDNTDSIESHMIINKIEIK